MERARGIQTGHRHSIWTMGAMRSRRPKIARPLTFQEKPKSQILMRTPTILNYWQKCELQTLCGLALCEPNKDIGKPAFDTGIQRKERIHLKVLVQAEHSTHLILTPIVIIRSLWLGQVQMERRETLDLSPFWAGRSEGCLCQSLEGSASWFPHSTCSRLAGGLARAQVPTHSELLRVGPSKQVTPSCKVV